MPGQFPPGQYDPNMQPGGPMIHHQINLQAEDPHMKAQEEFERQRHEEDMRRRQEEEMRRRQEEEMRREQERMEDEKRR